MRQRIILLETFGLFGITLLAVGWIRLGGVMSEQAWWLIPFLWITAACLPALWTPSPVWLTRQGFFGSPSLVFREVLRLSLLVFPVFGIIYLLYSGASIPPRTGFRIPEEWGNIVFYQVMYVGFSEELFFRGYLQQRLDECFGRPFRCFGAPWGWGLLTANGLFAAGHWAAVGPITTLDVFFPGLLFGWLQARTGAVLAPVLLHGLSNVLLLTLRNWT